MIENDNRFQGKVKGKWLWVVGFRRSAVGKRVFAWVFPQESKFLPTGKRNAFAKKLVFFNTEH